MQTPDCLKRWARIGPYAWKHPDREYRVSYAICGDRIVWDCWLGQTTKAALPLQVDGGLESAADAVRACRRHSQEAA